jgi:chromate transporter
VYYQRLGELAAYFVRLGVTAFGGPAAHIALMEEDCVRRRHWITRERFLDVLGAANLIPGPTSTELAMHIGYARAGWAGLLVAGVCFIVPAALIVAALAAVYVTAGSLPAFEGLLRAIKPVVVVVVLSALLTLAGTAVRSFRLAAFVAISVVLALQGMNEVAILLLAGIANIIVAWRPAGTAMALVLVPDLFAYFVKTGSVIFGSGYVLFALLRGDLVERYRWISEAQLLDAIAVGQVTPGPVFTAATFIGYLVAGPTGAVAATVGIFLPAFVFAALSAKAVERLRDEPVARAFLDGVNAAAVALIAVVLFALARHAIVDFTTAAIAIAAAVAIAWFRVNAAWVILGAAAMGVAAPLR